jgi:spore photoproduct lyase
MQVRQRENLGEKLKKKQDTIKLDPNEQLILKLPPSEQTFLKQKIKLYNFSHQETKQLIEIAIDLEMWDEKTLFELWDDSKKEKFQGKKLRSELLKSIKIYYEHLKNSPNSYENFTQPKIKAPKIKLISEDKKDLGFGMCPVASSKTRCCNLLTLDAVESCGFDCSYCSIQSFYNDGKITFDTSLKEKLGAIKLDKDELYHIGTGQSSDSLMWGNRFDNLEHLVNFARKNPNVLLEFKTKSDNISYFLEQKNLPKNLLFTWSLNPQIIIDKEEHLTASLDERLSSAKKLQEKGCLVGFHFHPMIYIENWKDEYGAVFEKLISMFDPKKVVLISFGTLTFIKPVIKQIRKREFKTKILQMPLENASGKFSYPLDIKKEMFKFAYDALSFWHKEVYFYMCMENSDLWRDVFGYEYPTNESFEMDMKFNYLRKIL